MITVSIHHFIASHCAEMKLIAPLQFTIGASQHNFHIMSMNKYGRLAESFLLDPASGSAAYKKAIIPIYFVLQIFGGHVGVPIILATLILSKGMRRHPLLINFLVTWVLYSTAFCLL